MINNFIPVVRLWLYPYLYNATAADYFLQGNLKCLVEVAFLSILSKNGQQVVNPVFIVVSEMFCASSKGRKRLDQTDTNWLQDL